MIEYQFYLNILHKLNKKAQTGLMHICFIHHFVEVEKKRENIKKKYI